MILADKEFGEKCVDLQQKIFTLCQVSSADPNVVLSVFAAMTASLIVHSSDPKEVLEMFNRGLAKYYDDLMKKQESGENSI